MKLRNNHFLGPAVSVVTNVVYAQLKARCQWCLLCCRVVFPQASSLSSKHNCEGWPASPPCAFASCSVSFVVETCDHKDLHHTVFTTCSLYSSVIQDMSNSVYLYSSVTFVCVWFGQYADPVADLLDQWGVFRARLFRESCVFHRGNYVKDLSRLGRELSNVIIVDNSPASYIFHPENAVSP